MSRKLPNVSGWPLRRKLALALAVPMLFAATFGGLRVAKEMGNNADHSAAASQVTVLPSAVAYLDAAEDAAVVARRKTAAVDPERDKAVVKVNAAADDFAAAADAADLSPTAARPGGLDPRAQHPAARRDGLPQRRPVRLPGPPAPARRDRADHRHRRRADPARAAAPGPRQAIDGRVSLAMQQFQVAYDDGADANPVDLAAELGVEAATIDRLGAALGTTQAEVAR